MIRKLKYVVNVRRQGDLVLNVTSPYALQGGLDASIKRQFWVDLEGMVGVE